MVQDPTVALDVVGKLLDAVVADDRAQIGRHLAESDSSVPSAEQLENVFGFAAASGWVDEVEGCDTDPPEEQKGAVLGVVCRIVSGHPIFGATGDVVVWNLSVEGDKIVDADPTPYLQNTNKDDDLFQWLMTQHPDSALERCDPDSSELSDVVISPAGYRLDARCGAYLDESMLEYFAATEPDHPVAVWYRFNDAFDNARLPEMMGLLTEDAVMQHLAGDGQTGEVLSYVGHDEIREFFEQEFKAFPNYERAFSDFFMEGSFVSFKMLWGPAEGVAGPGRRRGGAIYESVVEDGLIQRWVEVKRLLID